MKRRTHDACSRRLGPRQRHRQRGQRQLHGLREQSHPLVDTSGTITTIADTGEKGFSADAAPPGRRNSATPSGPRWTGTATPTSPIVRTTACAASTRMARSRRSPATPKAVTRVTVGRARGQRSGPIRGAQRIGQQGLRHQRRLQLRSNGRSERHHLDDRRHRSHRLLGGRRAGQASTAVLCPDGMALGPDGSLYIADAANHRVRKVALL